MNRLAFALLVLALTPACMVTRATHTLLASPRAPEQAPELEHDVERSQARLWIVTEDGERRLALDHLALPPGLPEGFIRARQAQERRYCSMLPSLVRDRSHAEDHLIEVKRAKDWEVLARVPGYVEEPGVLGVASAWALTPLALVIDTPINLAGLMGLGIAALLDELF